MLFNGEYSLYEYKKDNENNYSKQFILPEKQKKKISSDINNTLENHKSKEREEILNSHPVFKLNDERTNITNKKLSEALTNNNYFLEKDDNLQEKDKDLDVTIQDMFMEIIDDKFATEKLKNNKRQSLVETIKSNKINIKDDMENDKIKVVTPNMNLNESNPISFSTKQNTENIKRYDSKTNSVKILNATNKKRGSIIEHIESLENDLNKMSVIQEENVNLESSHLMLTKKEDKKKIEITRNADKMENENIEKQKVNKRIVKVEKANIKEILNREYDYLYKMYYQVDKNIFDKNLAIKLYNNIVNKTTYKSKHLTKILKDFKFNKINHSQFNKETKVINGPKFVIQMSQQLISEVNVLRNLENVSLPSLIYYILAKCMLNVLSSNLFSYMKSSIDEISDSVEIKLLNIDDCIEHAELSFSNLIRRLLIIYFLSNIELIKKCKEITKNEMNLLMEGLLKNKTDIQAYNIMLYKTISIKPKIIKDILLSNNNSNDCIQKHVLKTFSNKKPTTKKNFSNLYAIKSLQIDNNIVKNTTISKKKDMFKKLTNEYPFFFESSLSLVDKFLSAA